MIVQPRSIILLSMGMFWLWPLAVWEKKRYVLPFSMSSMGISLRARTMGQGESPSSTGMPARR